MENLYQISEKLLSIFNTIESNEGEVTEEELHELEITQEKLQEKLTDYKKAIRVWEADIDACKQEEKRIKSARQVKENRITRLKDNMLFAIQKFGYEGKPNKKGKTNKYYELSDGRIYTRTTESVEIDENRINILINLLIDLCNENTRIFPNDEEEFYEFILNHINDKLHVYYEGQNDFTIDELRVLDFDYLVTINIKDLILKYSENIKEYDELGIPFLGLTHTTPKSVLKLLLDTNKELTIAKIKETESLTIK